MTSQRFIASAPGSQNEATFRQFRDLQLYLERLEDRLKPVTSDATYGSLVLQDVVWQAVPVIDSNLSQEPGLYTAVFSMFLTGTNANAEAQFRIVDASSTVLVTGDIIPVGNRSTQFTFTLTIPQGANLALEARGIACTIESGTLDAWRIGVAP